MTDPICLYNDGLYTLGAFGNNWYHHSFDEISSEIERPS